MLPEVVLATIYMSVLYYGDNQQAFHALEAAFPISFVLKLSLITFRISLNLCPSSLFGQSSDGHRGIRMKSQM